MFQVVISGNLTAPPKQLSSSRGQTIYGINFACNSYQKSKSGEMEKKVYWVSGIIYESKIKSILPYLKKGTYVVATTNTAGLSVYTSKKTGEPAPKLDLKILQTLEAGNLDRSGGDQVQNQPQIGPSTQNYNQGSHYPGSMPVQNPQNPNQGGWVAPPQGGYPPEAQQPSYRNNFGANDDLPF